MKISDVLARAAKLVERGWCQHHPAMTRDGQPRTTEAQDAVKFCMLGAVWRAIGPRWNVEYEAENFLSDFIGPAGIVTFNEAHDRTGPEVACWLSSAAEYARVVGR